MTTYFSQFPLIAYSLGSDSPRLATDVFASIKLMIDLPAKFKDLFVPYLVEDGETPEAFANRVYGSSDWYWVAIISSGKVQPENWPLSNDDLQLIMERKYGPKFRELQVLVDADLNPLPTKIRTSFTDQNGNTVNWQQQPLVQGYGANTDGILFYNGSLRFLTDVEEQKNDALRKISVIDPLHLQDFVSQFQQLMASRRADGL